MGGRAARIGTVGRKDLVVTGSAGKRILSEDCAGLKRSWQSTFGHKLEGGGRR
jgi:hypothetical protein